MLEAQGYADALARIHEVAEGLDPNTMGLQYLETMRALGANDTSTWIIPTELTKFLANFQN